MLANSSKRFFPIAAIAGFSDNGLPALAGASFGFMTKLLMYKDLDVDGPVILADGANAADRRSGDFGAPAPK
jgi:hypothetical protein